jgi:hypothetical protein
MTGEDEFARLAYHCNLSQAVLRHLKLDIITEKKMWEPRMQPRLECRAKDPLASPVGAYQAMSGGGDFGLSKVR